MAFVAQSFHLWYDVLNVKGEEIRMSGITKQEVEHVANLARLSLSEADKVRFTQDLNSILTYVEKLNELDTESVVPTTHVLPLANVVREDRVRPSVSVEEALLNTAEHKNNQVIVPSVFER
jgi:aspartyl-tRNA(Asn)/glutamyl-tRNA(Gln) amidotransferase subunit C